MIPNEENEGWYYLAVKKLSVLFIILKSNGCFYSLNCLHFFRTGYKFKCHEKICKNRNF